MGQNKGLMLMLISVTCALVRPYTWTLAYVSSTPTVSSDKELPPQLLPIVLAKFYKEGSNVNLFCSLAEGDRQSPINYEWLKDNQRIRIDSHFNPRLTSEQDLDKSILKVANVQANDAGNYTCLVRNRYGKDSVTVQLRVKVDLKWIKQPSETYDVGVGKNLIVNCEAQGQPSPTIRWSWLSGGSTSNAITYLLNATNHNDNEQQFKITSATLKDSGIYECIANNGVDQELRKVFKVNVQVPARFNEKFSVVQAKGGESAKLECNATGDQPLTINWYKEDNIKLSKRGGENFEIYETLTTTGLNSVLVMRTVNRADGVIYKCIGENEFGNDEKLIKLVIVEVPSKPLNVRVKDVWSRSASLVWSSPFAGNSPITSYIIQYWKRQSVEQQQQQQQTGVQAVALNHRRQEFTVSGSQTSALITNLNPALTYEASIIAENQVGRSEPSENIVISTGEEEPSSPPTDVTVEARGPSTIKVSWKVPPSESWNGKLQGFYIGFRPRNAPNSIDTHQPSAPQIIGQTSGSYSFKTVDAIKSQLVYESFLTNLMRGYEYEVIVKAFNNAGSGPDSHLMHVRTYDGDLPAPPTLFAHQTTTTTISVRWSYPSRTPTASIRRYTIYYQRQGDDSWLETGVSVDDKSAALQRLAAAAAAAAAANNQAGGNNNQQQEQQASAAAASAASNDVNGVTLTGLEPGFTYKIYAVAVNNFGMGDPSNIVTTKTEQLTSLNGEIISSSRNSNQHQLQQAADQFNMLDMNRQYQLFLLIPILCTIILVGFIISVVIFCSKRMQRPQNGGAGLPIQQAWGPNGTMQANSGYPTQRYVEFDKNIMKPSSAGSDQGSTVGGSNNVGHYPLPYGTLPMNAVVISDQKPWDQRPHSIMVKEPLKPQVTHTHIYDSPQ